MPKQELRSEANRVMDWEHYPENDVLPEHYSSPFGIILRDGDRWDIWITTAMYEEITSPEGLQIAHGLGSVSQINRAKLKVQEMYDRLRRKGLAMAKEA